MIGLQLDEMYDTHGRYHYRQLGFEPLNSFQYPQLYNVSNINPLDPIYPRLGDKIALKGSIDALRFTKQLMVITNKSTQRLIQGRAVKEPAIINYQQAQAYADAQHDIVNFPYHEYTITMQGRCDLSVGQSIYYRNPDIVRESDSGDNTVKLMIIKIVHSYNSGGNGKGFQTDINCYKEDTHIMTNTQPQNRQQERHAAYRTKDQQDTEEQLYGLFAGNTRINNPIVSSPSIASVTSGDSGGGGDDSEGWDLIPSDGTNPAYLKAKYDVSLNTFDMFDLDRILFNPDSDGIIGATEYGISAAGSATVVGMWYQSPNRHNFHAGGTQGSVKLAITNQDIIASTDFDPDGTKNHSLGTASLRWLDFFGHNLDIDSTLQIDGDDKKIGFFDVTPVSQQAVRSSATDASKLTQIYNALQNLGLIYDP